MGEITICRHNHDEAKRLDLISLAVDTGDQCAKYTSSTHSPTPEGHFPIV